MARLLYIVVMLIIAVAPLAADDPPQAAKPAEGEAPKAAATTAAVYAFRAGGGADTILKNLEGGSIDGATALDQLSKLDTVKRWTGVTRNDVVEIWAFYRKVSDKTLTIDIKEEPRETLFIQQLGDLVKIATSLGGLAAQPPIQVRKTYYKLKHVRADLTVTASIGDKETPIKPSTGTAPAGIIVIDLTGNGKPANASTGSISVVTGPREGWSISADVGLNRLNELKVTEKNGLVLKEEKPSTFYASFNYLPRGDLFLPPKDIKEAVFVKILLSASRTPTSAYGLGIGLRPGYFAARFPQQSFLHILDTVSPFVAAISLRHDEVDEAGVAHRGDRKIDVQAGISLDLKTAAGWLKPKKEEDKK